MKIKTHFSSERLDNDNTCIVEFLGALAKDHAISDIRDYKKTSS